jgi:hypothetical protein
MNMNRLPINYRTPNWRVAIDTIRLRNRYRPVLCDLFKSFSVDAADHSILRVAQSGGILRDDVQHRLDVRRRAGDDAKNLTGRSLLLQGFLEFLEQTNILYRNHGLIGEGFEQSDLRGREGVHL